MAADKKAYLRNAQKQVQKGQLDRAVTSYKAILKIDPNDVKTHNALGDIYIRRSMKKDGIKEYLWVADYYEKDGFFLRSIAICQKILNLDAGLVDVRIKLAELYTQQRLGAEAKNQYLIAADFHDKQGKVAEALEIFGKIADLDPSNLGVRVKLAKMYEKQDLPHKAAKEYTRAAEGHIKEKEIDRAATFLRRALELHPESPTARRCLADYHVGKEEWPEAVKQLAPLVAGETADIDVLKTYAGACLKTGQTAEAIEALERARASEPSSRPLKTLLGRAYLEGDAFDKALEIYNPTISDYLKDNKVEAAEDLARQLVEANPSSDKAQQRLLDVLHQKGDSEEIPGIYSRLAAIYEGKGLPRNAVGALEKYLELKPGDREAAEKIKALRGGIATPPAPPVAAAPAPAAAPPAEAPPAVEAPPPAAAAPPASPPPAVESAPSAAAPSETAPPPAAAPSAAEAPPPEAAPSAPPPPAEELMDVELIDLEGEDLADISLGEDMGVELPEAIDAVPASPGEGETVDEGLDIAADEVEVTLREDEEEILLEEDFLEEVPAVEAPAVEEAPPTDLEPAAAAAAEAPPMAETAPVEEVDLEGPGPYSMGEEISLVDEEAIEAPVEPAAEEPGAALDMMAESILPAVEAPAVEEAPPPDLEPAVTAEVPGSPAEGESPELDMDLDVLQQPSEGLPEETKEAAPPKPPAVEEAIPAAREGPSEEMEEFLAEADFYLQQGLFDEAEFLYRKLTKLDPGSEDIAARIRRLEEEKARTEKSVASTSTHRETAPVVGEDEIAALENDLDRVLSDRKAPPPGTGVKLSVSGEQGPGGGEFSDFLSDLRQELDTDEISADVPAVSDEESLSEIFQEFQEGLKEQLGEEDFETHYNLGIAYKEMGLLDEALGEFILSEKSQARKLDSVAMIALCLRDMGREEEAIAKIEEGLVIAEKGSDEEKGFLYDLADLYGRHGRENDAAGVFDRLFAIDPSYRDVSSRSPLGQSASGKAGKPAKESAAASRSKKPKVSYL